VIRPLVRLGTEPCCHASDTLLVYDKPVLALMPLPSPAPPRDSDPALPAGVVRLPVPEGDVGLVAALRAGRPEATGALFDRYARHVQRVLARVLGPDPELNDLLQDVFVAALESVDRLEEARALRSWLTSIAVFTARARIRRRVRWRFLRVVPSEEIPELPAVTASPETSEALRCTYEVLSELPPDERIAFALRFIDGMELTEVASTCRVSLATIKRRLRRARDRFAALASEHRVLAEWLEATP
jgi:RNA polymerase sigma-70 factor (ECF subfamily)